jgi:hypothetical protein
MHMDMVYIKPYLTQRSFFLGVVIVSRRKLKENCVLCTYVVDFGHILYSCLPVSKTLMKWNEWNTERLFQRLYM